MRGGCISQTFVLTCAGPRCAALCCRRCRKAWPVLWACSGTGPSRCSSACQSCGATSAWGCCSGGEQCCYSSSRLDWQRPCATAVAVRCTAAGQWVGYSKCAVQQGNPLRQALQQQEWHIQAIQEVVVVCLPFVEHCVVCLAVACRLANEITNLSDAATLYPLFGLGANLAQAIAGLVLKVSFVQQRT